MLFNLQFLGFYVPLLPAVLCFLRLANSFVCIKHNASRGHVSLLYISPSNTRRASLTYTPQAHLSTIFFQEDIQTISWPEVVRRIGAIRNSNPLTELSSSSSRPRASEGAKLDAHDIANRIMRQENFLIALFNKELLDLRVPLPHGWPTEEGKGRTLTRALEWNLQFCLMEYLFDRRGRVRKVFLKSKNRTALIDGCVIRKDHATIVVDVGPQAKKTSHFHGHFERYFRTIHRRIRAYVLVLPIFRSTYPLSRHGAISNGEENRNHTKIHLQSVVAHILPLRSGSSGNSMNSPTFLRIVSRSHTPLLICT
jgi:Autophagy protein ATG9